MATDVFRLTAAQIIVGALRDAKIIASQQPIQPKDLVNGLLAMQLVLKNWQTQGLHLWSETQAVLPLIPNLRKYKLGPSGALCAVGDTFFQNSLMTDNIAGNNLINVSTTGNNDDGESLSMAEPQNLYLTNPVTNIGLWTATNSAVLSIVGSTLEIENGAASAGGAFSTFQGEIGHEYEFRFEIGIQEVSGVNVTISTSPQNSTTVNVTVSTPQTLRFTAEAETITILIENVSAVLGDQNTLDVLEVYDTDDGDRIGMQLDDGTRFWTRVLRIISSTQIQIVDQLPSAATTGNTVQSFSKDIARPMRLTQAQFGSSFTASEIPTHQWSRSDYFDQPDKGSKGTVVNWYYSPKLGLGELYVWQVASSINNILRFTYVDPIEIPENSTDSIDVPSEWYMALKWAIASELGPSYGVSENRQLIIESKASGALVDASDFDVENTSFRLQPDFD